MAPFLYHTYFKVISLPLKFFFQEILIRFLQTRDGGREMM